MTTEPTWLAGLEKVSDGTYRDPETGLQVTVLTGRILQVRDSDAGCGIQFNCLGKVECNIWTGSGGAGAGIIKDALDLVAAWERTGECVKIAARLAEAYQLSGGA